MRNKYLNWVAIALVVVALVAIILALFKAEEGWLGFWGGIIGSAIGVLGAFLLLKEQVNYDRDALKEQLNEEREQNRKQQIDNTFFNLLSMHNEQINDLKRKNKFGKVYKELGRNLQIDEELRKETVENVLSRHYDEVGAYFRLFHRIIKYINDNLDQSEELAIKNNYIGFLRATVNEEEMLVIFYNAAYTKRGQGLLDELQKTTFFGNREDIMNNQHFDRKKLFWEKNDVNKMLEKQEK